MTPGGDKSEDAFRTIGELSAELGIPQHILRYWESRFPQLKPLQRAGNRRYYRPADAALVRRIHSLLNDQGYTIKGVQKLLAQKGGAAPEPEAVGDDGQRVIAPPPVLVVNQSALPRAIRAELEAIRDSLKAALATDME
ncbi:MerR family transcriptional regulator [Sphingomonas montanisoli]|uniref:MerR family transcriptional regulator n=1 Tax=Sphingomonas montanisoli TaxID=2606412 RepID=A0A5D9CC11_9SPHN|nr:MerR family transcriptional regulator [Sphingomonas montanisoli]TZG28926.1 MerR family transcriptional regulator [Sphingomonas montanisoli]